MADSKRVVVITGASSGIGAATARHFFVAGDIVYNLSRSEGELDTGAKFIATDVADRGQVEVALARVVEEQGRIDVLINNAGFGISGSSEGTDCDDIEKLFSVNFMGVTNCTNTALKYMREARRGKIICVSSLAAAYPLPYQSYYSASKAAITAYTSALKLEVKNFGIKCTSVLLGDVRTSFTRNREKSEEAILDYRDFYNRAMKVYENDEQNRGALPTTIAKQMYKLSQKKNPNHVVVFGIKSKLLVFFTRFLPTRFVNYSVGKKY